MRSKFMAGLTLALTAGAIAAAPIAAEAATRRVWVCSPRHAANTGTAVGAVAGGLLGNAVAARGVKTEGTVLGAGVGAVVGHEVAKRKRCHYAYVQTRTYSRR